MPKSSFVDFRAIKAAITMEQLLEHYSLLDRFKRSGDSLSGPCPIHKGENPTQFRVSISKNIWNCFSECKQGGNTLDFVSRMENITIHAAALKVSEWFGIDDISLTSHYDEGIEQKHQTAKSQISPKSIQKKHIPVTEKIGPNKPLKFRLDKLIREHPYLSERGLHSETIAEFGVGFCTKGMMAERIAIPILNAEGEVVAYAGRVPGEPLADQPKYKLPQGFRKSLELFNINRAAKEPAEKALIIVEGFFDCMKLYQYGCRKVVALMGSSMSTAQEELIRKYTNVRSRVIVMLDEDEAGRAGREDVAVRLAKFVFVKIQVFKNPDTQPEHLTAQEVQELIKGMS